MSAPTHIQCLLCGWNRTIDNARRMPWGLSIDTPIVRSMILGGKVSGVAKGRGKAPGKITVTEISTAPDSDEQAVESQRLGIITLVKAAIESGWIKRSELR